PPAILRITRWASTRTVIDAGVGRATSMRSAAGSAANATQMKPPIPAVTQPRPQTVFRVLMTARSDTRIALVTLDPNQSHCCRDPAVDYDAGNSALSLSIAS